MELTAAKTAERSRNGGKGGCGDHQVPALPSRVTQSTARRTGRGYLHRGRLPAPPHRGAPAFSRTPPGSVHEARPPLTFLSPEVTRRARPFPRALPAPPRAMQKTLGAFAAFRARLFPIAPAEQRTGRALMASQRARAPGKPQRHGAGIPLPAPPSIKQGGRAAGCGGGAAGCWEVG